MDDRRLKVLLIFSLMLSAVATFISYQNPARGFEGSIYAGTPTGFWLAVFGSIIAGVSVLVYSRSRFVQSLSLLAISLSVFLVIILPIIRGYWMIGGDSLNHLAHVRDVIAGDTDSRAFLYPGMHTMTGVLSSITGSHINWALMLTVPIFAFAFVSFIPLVVRRLTPEYSRFSFYAGAILALTFPTINLITNHFTPHSSSFATFFAPFVIFLTVALASNSRNRWRGLLIIAFAASILIHPQITLGALTVAFAIFYVHSNFSHDSVMGTRDLSTMVVLLGCIFTAWIYTKDTVMRSITATISGIIQISSVDVTNSRADSFGALGISIGELFAKIFVFDAILCLLAAITGLLYLHFHLPEKYQREVGWLHPVSEGGPALSTLSIALATIPTITLILFFLFGGVTQQYLRFQGFFMALVTILATVAVVQFCFRIDASDIVLPGAFSVVVVSLVLIVSIMLFWPSPFIYKTSGHISDNLVDGYETQIEYHNEGTPIVSVTGPTNRYANGIGGDYEENMRKYSVEYGNSRVGDHFENRSLSTAYADTRILVTTDHDKFKYMHMLDGYRYNEGDYRYLKESPGVNKIHTTGGFEAYHIEGTVN